MHREFLQPCVDCCIHMPDNPCPNQKQNDLCHSVFLYATTFPLHHSTRDLLCKRPVYVQRFLPDISIAKQTAAASIKPKGADSMLSFHLCLLKYCLLHQTKLNPKQLRVVSLFDKCNDETACHEYGSKKQNPIVVCKQTAYSKYKCDCHYDSVKYFLFHFQLPFL